MLKVLFTLFASLAVGSMTLIGGYRDVDVTRDDALKALSFAVDQHNIQSNDLYLSKATEVLRVQLQVVAGLKYKITARMAFTNCRKEHANLLNDGCAIHQDQAMARPSTCTFTVWSQVWIESLQLMQQECQPEEQLSGRS